MRVCELCDWLVSQAQGVVYDVRPHGEKACASIAAFEDEAVSRVSHWLKCLREAAEGLIACRRTLKNTYAYAYFMEDGPEKALFEVLQAE